MYPAPFRVRRFWRGVRRRRAAAGCASLLLFACLGGTCLFWLALPLRLHALSLFGIR